jgi:hypothetical protein
MPRAESCKVSRVPRWRCAAVLAVGCLALPVPSPLRAQVETRDPLPVPDIQGYRTLKADFHLHTVFSDGTVWPTVRVQEAWRDGLDAIAITDHLEYRPYVADVTTPVSRAYESARPLAGQLGIVLIPGDRAGRGVAAARAHHARRADRIVARRDRARADERPRRARPQPDGDAVRPAHDRKLTRAAAVVVTGGRPRSDRAARSRRSPAGTCLAFHRCIP